MPAALAALAGGWSPILIVCVGFASLLIAVTFAEVGSRFDATGGPYLYTRAAFGRFAAFEVGWMQWFTRVASWASVINVLVASLGFYWPAVTAGTARTVLLTAIITVLAAVNVLGIRQSAWVVNTLTIGKLQSFDPAQSQELLRSLTAGLGVALLTTMVGLVGNILLGLQLTRLDRFADVLVADIQKAGLKKDAA